MQVLSSELLRNAGFPNGFSLRSCGSFHPSPEREKNVRGFASLVGFDPAALYQTTQVHGASVARAGGDREATLAERADAIVAFASAASIIPPFAVGVRIADCVPVLVGDTKSGAVVAIHAGWRGLVAGVVAAGVGALRASPRALVAAIGPSIGPCCFEVGSDVGGKIAIACGDADVVVREDEGRAKAWVDLRRAVRVELRREGLADANVEDVPGCTKCAAEQFFSYRRDGENGGRHLAAIRVRA
jgi:purine-nucleoside/S-methyl-5'-thioadenosine phosphorylase / adenosine deaminase